MNTSGAPITLPSVYYSPPDNAGYNILLFPIRGLYIYISTVTLVGIVDRSV